MQVARTSWDAPRLDKNYGYLRDITRNQKERKAYHEQSLKQKVGNLWMCDKKTKYWED